MKTTTQAKVDASVAALNAVKARIAELTGDNSIIGRGTIAPNEVLANQCGLLQELRNAMEVMWDEQCKVIVSPKQPLYKANDRVSTPMGAGTVLEVGASESGFFYAVQLDGTTDQKQAQVFYQNEVKRA